MRKRKKEESTPVKKGDFSYREIRTPNTKKFIETHRTPPMAIFEQDKKARLRCLSQAVHSVASEQGIDLVKQKVRQTFFKEVIAKMGMDGARVMNYTNHRSAQKAWETNFCKEFKLEKIKLHLHVPCEVCTIYKNKIGIKRKLDLDGQPPEDVLQTGDREDETSTDDDGTDDSEDESDFIPEQLEIPNADYVEPEECPQDGKTEVSPQHGATERSPQHGQAEDSQGGDVQDPQPNPTQPTVIRIKGRCSECPKASFKFVRGLKEHVVRVHRRGTLTPEERDSFEGWVCPDCHKPASTPDNHIGYCPAKKKKCDKCNRWFTVKTFPKHVKKARCFPLSLGAPASLASVSVSRENGMQFAFLTLLHCFLFAGQYPM